MTGQPRSKTLLIQTAAMIAAGSVEGARDANNRGKPEVIVQMANASLDLAEAIIAGARDRK